MTSSTEGGRCRVALVAGARPNFMKIAPIHAAMRGHSILEPVLVHTGQHYDDRMSRVFLEELALPEPAVNLGVGSGSHARQTADVMIAFERALESIRPDAVIVVGDVNSTLGAAIVAQRQGVTLGHVEAGLRSGDRSMPEEINRVLTDQLADWLYTPSADAAENLLAEGLDAARIVFAGNVMIDSLIRSLELARNETVLEHLGLTPRGYALVTMHRPSNVDRAEAFQGILEVLGELSTELPVVFPVHPRTRPALETLGSLAARFPDLHLVDPQPYLAFVKLTSQARLVVTDSGGIQEETTYLDVPCLTVRTTTERPVTVREGTNILVGTDPRRLREAIRDTLSNGAGRRRIPERWDGHASRRIVEHLSEVCGK